jgi:hypothetical protein
MGMQSTGAGFEVDTAVFDELSGLYAGILDTLSTATGLASDATTPSTGSDGLNALVQALQGNVARFFAATSTNVTLDRDGLATARSRYLSSDAKVVDATQRLNDATSIDLPLVRWLEGLVAPRASGPADRVVAPPSPTGTTGTTGTTGMARSGR